MAQEEFQEVREPVVMEGVNLDPKFPRSLWISNIVRRTIIWLYATASGKLQPLQANADGDLKVDDDESQALLAAIQAAVEGTLAVSGIEQIPDVSESFEGTLAADAWTGLHSFTAESRVITITCEDQPGIFQFLGHGGGYTGEFFLPADTGRSFNFRSTGFRVKNYTGGSNTKFQVINDYVG